MYGVAIDILNSHILYLTFSKIGCGVEPIFGVQDKRRATNMKFPLKGCGQVGHKTFTSNHCYWDLYHKNLPKTFFPS